MKIIKTYAWNRRDFSFDAECEACGHVIKDCSGYDDSYFYNSVMPDKKCTECGFKTNDAGVPETITPKHNENKIM